MTREEIDRRISAIDNEIRTLSPYGGPEKEERLRSLEKELLSLQEEKKRVGYVKGMFSAVAEALEQEMN